MGNAPVAASGSLPSGESFRNAKEFKAYLLNRKGQFTHALTEKLLTYALGRGLEFEDACEVDRIAAAMPSHDHKFSSLILEVVNSIPFRMREGQRSKP